MPLPFFSLFLLFGMFYLCISVFSSCFLEDSIEFSDGSVLFQFMDASEIERQKAEAAELQEKKLKETTVETISEGEKSDLSDMDADKREASVSEEVNMSTQFDVGSGVETEPNKENGSKSIDFDGDSELRTPSTDLATDIEKENKVQSFVTAINPSFESQQTKILVTDANTSVDTSSSDLIISAKESVRGPYDEKIGAASSSKDAGSDQIGTDQSILECNEASDASTGPESDTDSETESSISSIEEHDEESNLSNLLLVYSMCKLLFHSILD
jgi:hypothetical protein